MLLVYKRLSRWSVQNQIFHRIRIFGIFLAGVGRFCVAEKGLPVAVMWTATYRRSRRLLTAALHCVVIVIVSRYRHTTHWFDEPPAVSSERRGTSHHRSQAVRAHHDSQLHWLRLQTSGFQVIS